MKTIVAVLALLLAVPAQASQEGYYAEIIGGGVGGAALGYAAWRVFDGETGRQWSKTDTALELTLVAVSFIDVCQTSWFLRDPSYSESNPLLGRHPSQLELNLFTLGALVTHAAIAYALPKPYRSIWQGLGIGVETSAIAHNFSIGVSLALPW